MNMTGKGDKNYARVDSLLKCIIIHPPLTVIYVLGTDVYKCLEENLMSHALVLHRLGYKCGLCFTESHIL